MFFSVWPLLLNVIRGTCLPPDCVTHFLIVWTPDFSDHGIGTQIKVKIEVLTK